MTSNHTRPSCLHITSKLQMKSIPAKFEQIDISHKKSHEHIRILRKGLSLRTCTPNLIVLSSVLQEKIKNKKIVLLYSNINIEIDFIRTIYLYCDSYYKYKQKFIFALKKYKMKLRITVLSFLLKNIFLNLNKTCFNLIMLHKYLWK